MCDLMTSPNPISYFCSGGLSNFLYYVSLPQDDSQSEATDDGKATTKSSSSSPPNQNNDNNRNVADFNDLLTTSSAGDCNGNKRKRYDSSSSTMSLKHKEPKEVNKQKLQNFVTKTVQRFTSSEIYKI